MSATIRGAVVKIELFLSGAWLDITCDTTTAEWQWGAPEALGPLTECEGGTLRVSLWDPARKYDPDNPSSPLLGALKVGLGFRVTVDGSAAWTGVLQTWAWDRSSKIADLNGLDSIGMLSLRAFPEKVTTAGGATNTAAEAQYVLDKVEWPTAKRYFPNGSTGVARGTIYAEGTALDTLQAIRFVELGRLYAMRDGRIGWHARSGPAPPASSAVINCGGVGLTDMWKVMGLGRVRNHVVVSGGYGTFGPVLPPDEYRSVTTSVEFLALDYVGGAPNPLPWDLWAQTILDALEHPPVLTMLGTILPQGAQVKQIVCAEFGDRWTVKATGEPDVVVQVFGQRVTLAPGTIEVDVVTEDIYTPKPYSHVTIGAGSASIASTHPTYANARSGVSSAFTIHPPGYQFFVGQLITAAPQYEVDEAFLWFDTSSIPVGATITEAVFGAMVIPHFLGVPPTGSWVTFNVEIRGGYAWLPTVTTADWRPGAGIAASYPLRATYDTSRAGAAEGYGGFFEWQDAGSGLAGAIVKGGQTQLFIVSSRTVAGTAPVGTAYEDLHLENPRLRVTYTVP